MQPTHAQLDAVRDRYEALEDPAAFEALTAERRAQVAHRAAAPWRTVDSRPDPWSALSEVPSERSSEALDEGWQLGLDRAGEVVLAELFFDDDWRAVVEVITRHDHRIEVVSWRQDELEVRTLWLDGSRPVCLVATGSMRRLDGRPAGFPLVAQDDPRSNGEVALLHVDPDVLGLPFLDGGGVLFFLPAADLAARRWDQVTAWPSSS